MPVWVGWVVAIAVAFLYVMSRNASADTVNVRKDVDDLRHEIERVWSRCGHLEGYVDAMAKRVIESDLFPDSYDSAVEAAKRWQEWRKEQMASSDGQ